MKRDNKKRYVKVDDKNVLWRYIVDGTTITAFQGMEAYKIFYKRKKD